MAALLCIICLAFISLGLPDTLLGSAWPVMRTDLAVDFAVAGHLTMCVQVGTVFSSLCSGRVIARFGTGKVTLTSVAMTAVALFGFSQAPHIALLFVWTVPMGLGAGSVDAALNHYVARNYAPRHMNWLHCFWGIGASAGPAIMSFALLRPGGWRTGYFIIAVLQAIVVLILGLTLPLWNRGRKESHATASQSVIRNRQALRIPCVKLALTAFIFYCAVESTVGLWSSSYLVAAKGFSPSDAARVASLFYAAITFGRFLSGLISIKVESNRLIRLGQITGIAGGIVLLLPLPGFFSGIGVGLLGLGLAPIFPAMIHETPRRFGETASQAVIGLQMAFAYIGAMSFPPLFGTLAEWCGIGILPAFAIGCAGIMFVASETLRRKLRGAVPGRAEVLENR